MGLNKQTLKILLKENQFKKISGKYLSIGRHTVNIDYDNLLAIFRRFGLSTKCIDSLYANQQFDELTRHSNRTVLDSDLLNCFSDAEYICLDRSDYEGATVIQDMNGPVPKELHGQFDFIYNGSCMDNLFDPFTFIKNTSDMLKSNGRVLHIEAAGGVPGAYLMYSPEWFFSYYAINEFLDCKVYVTIAKGKGNANHIYDTELYAWQPFYTRNEGYKIIDASKSINGLMHVIVIAEKGESSTSHLTPIQMQYLDDDTVDWRSKYYDFQKTARPLPYKKQKTEIMDLPFHSDHYIHLASKF